MRARAFSVTCNAQTVNFGHSQIRKSFETVPTTTAIRFSRPGFFMKRTTRAKEIGGRLIRLMNKRFKIIRLNLAVVRLAKNLYNYKIDVN